MAPAGQQDVDMYPTLRQMNFSFQPIGDKMTLNISKKWFERQAALEGDLEIGAGFHACHCIGPQNGQPVCPCADAIGHRRKRPVCAEAGSRTGEERKLA